MPKELKELKGFHKGTIYNIDEKDAPDESNIFSLNLNPMSESGILEAINADRLVLSINDNSTFFRDPITEGSSINNDSTALNYNNSKIHISDISILNDQEAINTVKVGTIKGLTQNLLLDDIEPLFEKVYFGLASTSTSTRTHTTNEVFGADSTYIQFEAMLINEDVSISNFAVTSTGIDNQTITITSGTASGYDGKYFSIRTGDGKKIVYEFNDSGSPGTGEIISSTRVCIQIQGLSSSSTITAAMELAIEDATNGHHTRVNVSRSANVLSINDVVQSFDTGLYLGDYFSIATGTFNGRSASEIFKFDYYDGETNRLYVKRNCFGSPTTALADATEYEIYGPKITTGTKKNGNQAPTKAASCKLGNWISSSSQNFIENEAQHIGGNSHHLVKCDAAGEKAAQGLIDSNAGSSEVIYDAAANTIKFGGSAAPTGFKKGDVVTIYHSSGSGNNNGNRYRIIGIGQSLVTDGWHVEVLDGSMISETENTDDVYIEANLVQNISFAHASNTSGATVSDTVASWTHNYYYNAGSAGLLHNYYLPRSANNLLNADGGTREEVASVASGGIWDTATGNTPYDLSLDHSIYYYPFNTSDKYIKIISEYDASNSSYFTQGNNSALLVTDTVIEFNNDITYELAYNDIITFETAPAGYDGDTEYMRVLAVNGTSVTVERGVYNSTIAQISYNTANKVTKNLNHHIHQNIDVDLLKVGQTYRLHFYGKGNSGSNGALAVVYNGGYFDGQGEWKPWRNNSTSGVLSSDTQRPTTGEQWVDFGDLTLVNGGTHLATFGVDTLWRKYELQFTLPHNLNAPQELSIKFASRGKESSELYIDLVTLIEHSEVHLIGDTTAHASSLSFIDNEGLKSLVIYDNTNNTLSAIENFTLNLPTSNTNTPLLSDFATKDIQSSSKIAAYTPNNREVHIGFGGKKSDTAPQWLGYVNHKIFGRNYTNDLYQDEDTVHRYDAEGIGRMSKITVAGEHEYLPATVSSSGTPGDANSLLTITHTAHSMNTGDNIVIREWEDTANNWTGSGVWVVTDGSGANAIVCKRFLTLDKNPIENSFLATSGDNARTTNTGRICYRPYYYYGFKEGVNQIYRITPSDRITDGGGTIALDIHYPAGTIEGSSELPFTLKSITTCHNKVITGADGTKGTGGGKIYGLSATTDQVFIIDVQKQYDEWASIVLSHSVHDLHFKSFKWSNDNLNGNIGGNTEVFPGGGLADISTPSVQYAGMLSDILETKGTAAGYNIKAKNQEENEPSDFDTRLWIQCHPEGSGSFTEGSRFLFCGLTDATNNVTGTAIYTGDRTPPTTSIVAKSSPTSYGNWHSTTTADGKFNAIPGVNIINSKYGYFASTLHSWGGMTYIRPCSDGYEAYESFFSGTGHKTSYYQFGYNVGWDCGTNVDVNELVLYTAKHGLFQMADNDCDGLIDGTGVVCANDISLGTAAHHSGATRDVASLPYGRHHRRVTSHVVGLLGKSENDWIRSWGHLAQGINDYWWRGAKANWDLNEGLEGWHLGNAWCDAPENMAVGACIFICSDIHLGDIYPDYQVSGENYYRNHDSNPSEGDDTLTTDATRGMKVQMLNEADVDTLQAGDLVYCYDDASPTKSFCTYIAGLAAADTIILPLTTTDGNSQFGADTLNLMPHGPCEVFINSESNDVSGTKQGSTFKRSQSIYHYTWDSQDPYNGAIFTEGIGCGKFTRTFMTPPTMVGYSGEEVDVSDVSGSNTGLAHNPYRPGILSCIEKLSFRSGYMIRPFAMSDADFSEFQWGSNLCIDSPGLPDTVFHEQNGDYLHYGINNSTLSGISETKNFFANRVYISSRKNSSIEAETVMHLIDLNIYGMDTANSVPYDADYQDEDSHAYNFGNEWDSLFKANIQDNMHITDGNVSTHAIMRRNTAENWYTEVGTDYCPIVRFYDTTAGASGYVSNMTGSAGYNPHPAGSPWKNMGAFAGQILVVWDYYSGKHHARYILNSWDSDRNSDDIDVHLQLHYPLPFTLKSGDKAVIWRHQSIVTSPAFLYSKLIPGMEVHTGHSATTLRDPFNEGMQYRVSETEENTMKLSIASSICTSQELRGSSSTFDPSPHNLITGDLIEIYDTNEDLDGIHSVTVTGSMTFTASTISGDATAYYKILNEDGKHQKANPLTLPLVNPVFKTMFGGLDMRKLKTYATTGTDIEGGDAGGAGEARVTLDAVHLLSAGDFLTISRLPTLTTGFIGSYIIKAGGATTNFDIVSADAGDDTSAQTIYTNQWESFVMETGGAGRIGELRAGLSCWDKGDSDNNIIRYDTQDEASTFMQVLGSNLRIIGASEADVDGDYFLKNTPYTYKVSLTYDGYQEGVLSQDFWVYSDTVTRSKVSVTINLASYSRRLSSVNVYRRDAPDQFFALVKKIPTESGWSLTSDGLRSFQLYDNGDIGKTYEAESELSEVLDTTQMKYGISVEIDGYLFVGDCGHEKIEHAANQIFRSKPGCFSLFDYANDAATLKSKPTAMANFLGRLFVFDDNHIYKINPETMFIEDIFEGIGCSGKNSVIVTEYGMFFANKFGAYKHDGTQPIKISSAIDQGGALSQNKLTSVGNFSGFNTKDFSLSWDKAVRNALEPINVTFDSKMSSALFFFKVRTPILEVVDETRSASGEFGDDDSWVSYYIWSFNLVHNRWDLWELTRGSKVGAPALAKDGEVLVPIGSAIYELQGGATKRKYSWISKKISAGQDSVLKIFKKIKLGGIDNDITFHNGNDSGITAITNSTTLSTGLSMTYVDADLMSEYKITSSDKKGAWIQVSLRNMEDSVDSIGIIFRRQRVK